MYKIGDSFLINVKVSKGSLPVGKPEIDTTVQYDCLVPTPQSEI